MEKRIPLFFVCLFQRNIFLVLLIEIKLEEGLQAALRNINIKVSGNYLVVYKRLNIMPYKEIEKTLTDIFVLSN